MAFPSSLTICDLYTCKADEITARVKTEMQELEHPGVAAPEPGMRLVHNGENYAVTSISPDGVVIMREDEEGNNSLPEVISLDTYYAEKQAEIDAQEQEQQPQSGESGEAAQGETAQEIASPAEEEPAPVTGGEAVQEETALGRIPKDEQGQPLYEQADAETAWDALLEQTGGDEAMAQEVANDIVSEQEKALKAAERELKKVQDGKPQQRKGDAPLTVEARIAAKQAVREQTSRAQAGVDEARKRLEAWRKIAETSQRRRQAIEAERRQEEQEAEEIKGIQSADRMSSAPQVEESGAEILNNKENSAPLQGNQTIEYDGTVSEPIPQGEHRTEAPQDSRMEEAANRLRQRSRTHESLDGRSGEALPLQERLNAEAREAESYAKETGQWIPMSRVFDLGVPGPSGNENDTYVGNDGYIYKVNNLMNSRGILPLLERYQLHNQIFPESKYELVGFTGFDGGSIYPVFRQQYVPGASLSTPEEIDAYMQSLGFYQTGEAEYSNGDVTISDLRPRNVLRDADSDMYVIDAEFRRNERKTSGKRQQPGGKKRGRKQIEKAIGMLREGLASGDFNVVRRALGMYWTNQYHGAEITEEEAAFVDGVLDNYRQQGIEIINPLGTRYDEGMKVVADFRTDDTLKPGENRIVGVREPQVNTDGVMSHSASIIVAISPVAEESPADVQGNADENIRRAESEVERNPSEAQKEAGNYRKGHVRVDGYDITIEQPKGSVRSGTDADGKRWETVMNNTYGYMRGTEGVDGDHIDVFLSDNPESGNVYVIDQRDPKTGEFDEHKVMYGFGSMEEARDAYLKNYTPGWQGLGAITEVSKDEFTKWIGSSKRKTKPFAEYKSVKKEAGQNEDVRQSRDGSSPLSAEEAAIRDAIVERLRESGIEVITDAEAGQRVLDEANGRGEPVRTQAMLDGLAKAASTIRGWIKGNRRGRVFTIDLPESTQRKIKDAMGRDFDSHNITANGIAHALKNHGVGGNKLNERSIPLREEDMELIPYIMTAPDYVKKASTDVSGRESVRFYKNLSNGYVVVVEKEYKNSPDDMETITMWAELSSGATNARQNAVPDTHVLNAIPSTDSAKIRKDAEDAIHGDEKVREHRVYHGSGADFEAFDHSHMGEGEGAQAYGWGSYVTEVEGIGRMYAENLARRVNHITYDGENLGDVLDNEYLFDETWRNWKLTLLYAETANDLKYLIRNLLFVPKGKNIRERKKNFERQKKELLAAIDNGRIKVEANNRHLYTVEIPDDTGENYLEWEKDYGWNDIDRFARRSGGEVDSGDLGVGLEDDGNAAASGASIVKSLEETFGEKEASEILSKCGFTGISYPAQATTGGRKDGARNYVIFDEKDLRITDHVRFFRTPGGEAYGFTAGGKIYIDPRVATADTPIHEYAHLWAGALRQANPKEWNNIVELMRGTPAWDEVKRLYPELESDEEIADEALAMYSGRRGAERLREAARRAWNESADLGIKAAAARAMGRVRDALRRFWQNVADLLHFRHMNAEEVADRVMRDLLEGVNPNRIKSATDNTGAFSAGNDDIRYSRAEEEDANRRFNVELDKWESGGMSANEYVTVGNPIGVLRHFTPDLPIILRQKVLSKSRKKHGLSASDMRNLPAALAEPIFIFKSSDNTIGVLTGHVSDSGENIFVAIELDANKQMGHQMLEVNDILTIHGRETENIINPIKENNTLKWVDKEKGLNWLSSAKSNSQAVTNKALDTATNIVKDFENPSLEDENLFRIGETKRIGGESLFGRRITFTRANPTVTLNAMKRWVLKNADLKEYDVSRTGSRYLSFTHNSVDYKIRSANHTKAYDGVRPESSGLSVSVEDRIYGVEIDLAENEMVKEDILRIIEDTDRLNDTGLNLQNTVESGVLPDEMVSADRELTDAVIREVREMAEWRLDSARTKAESEYEREHPLEDYKADNGIMILNRYFYGRVSYEVKFPDGWRGKTKQPRADAIQEYEDSDAHRRNMEQASGMNVYVDGRTKAQAETLRKIDGLANRLEQERMAGAVREMAERLHLEGVEVVTDASTLTGRRARAKGFYSPRTGKISIVIPNHASEADAVQTLLHEAVAHNGLRQLFGEHFDTFLWNVYRNADRDVRERINALASEKGWDFPTATEEYLASLAENTDFENAQRSGWWEKIKRLFIDMLHKMGLDRFSGVTLSDNELRYILWRSYENLREPGAERSITGVAADVVKQAELKVGNYAEEATGGNMAAERGKKEASETDSVLEREHQHTVISDATGTKVRIKSDKQKNVAKLLADRRFRKMA